MSDTVITLKGDSTQLIDALKKSGVAFEQVSKKSTDLKSEAKKLTDQLREVGDSADVAAGKMVNKIGGTTAIKAIGGVGLAFTGVSAALGALSSSMNSFYATQGKEGADAMNRVNTAVDTLQGTLFQAATGGMSAKESADLLVGVLDALTTVATVALTPLREIVQLFFGMSEDAREAAEGVDAYNAAVERSNANSDALRKSMGEIDAMMLQLTGTTEDNTRAVFANARAKIETQIEEVKAAAAVQNTIIAMTALASKYPEIERQAREAALTAERAGIIKPAAGETYAEAREKYAQKNIDENVKLYVQQVKDRNLAMVGERGAAIADLEAKLAKLDAKEAEVLAGTKSTTRTRTFTGGRTPAEEKKKEIDEETRKQLDAIEEAYQARISALLDWETQSNAALDMFSMRTYEVGYDVTGFFENLIKGIPTGFEDIYKSVNAKSLKDTLQKALTADVSFLELFPPGDKIVRQSREFLAKVREAYIDAAARGYWQATESVTAFFNRLPQNEMMANAAGESLARTVAESAKIAAKIIDETNTKEALQKLFSTKAPPLPSEMSLDDDPTIDRYKRQAQIMTAVMGRFYDWREIRDAETNALLDARDEESLKKKTANIEEYMKAYGHSIADQIVAGKSASEIMEATARKAMGNIISYIGDEAMAKGAVMAASGNPMAIAMFAAGTAAYATAAYLGSTAKKAVVSTPASSRSAEPGNAYFNLRVDATFADGESIARRFAEMQNAAARRGLLPNTVSSYAY